jgi:hypothetical protein
MLNDIKFLLALDQPVFILFTRLAILSPRSAELNSVGPYII